MIWITLGIRISVFEVDVPRVEAPLVAVVHLIGFGDAGVGTTAYGSRNQRTSSSVRKWCPVAGALYELRVIDEQ